MYVRLFNPVQFYTEKNHKRYKREINKKAKSYLCVRKKILFSSVLYKFQLDRLKVQLMKKTSALSPFGRSEFLIWYSHIKAIFLSELSISSLKTTKMTFVHQNGATSAALDSMKWEYLPLWKKIGFYVKRLKSSKFYKRRHTLSFSEFPMNL